MDDFGTGYGVLSYLRSFPFDKVKIDRALIAELTRTPEASALVEAIVGLSSKLGMAPVAEGVESKHQLERLCGFGCAEAQGFYFSSGVAAGEIEQVLALGPAQEAA